MEKYTVKWPGWRTVQAVIMATLITMVVMDQWHRYQFRGLLSGGCGYYVHIKYKYPDADLWTETRRLGPFRSEAFAERVATEVRVAGVPSDKMDIQIVEDCPQY